ncbi:type I phosphomannose isomerase catalytic subunit [Bifidobacterium sp.]|uniref:type I phosphomannose isomerase catalytic subunit n=1 Tax=Bifidobacterium sp. TaxID=41200 RepID=UPI0025C4AB2A|nr:type I phosphomannose isomerase catalytic subunit [Bifidobacterium sp.]MCH4209591.1 class I mannose-6-phosphate isomerase [Bifidobacterium sp.]MCI1225010.1 class I mannose-6-phosphate isomerase [Bifidobacterium sp.]
MYPIRPVAKRYAWGSFDRLQTMFSSRLPEPCSGPLAEMWFSGHPQWPSLLDIPGQGLVSVPDAIRSDPTAMVGERNSDRFGPVLPYLLKMISARIPLSLQVHPVGFEARAGYNAQNAAAVPFDSPERSFKDPVAKSEMVVAVEPFSASVGFASIPFMLRNLKLVDHPIAARMVQALQPHFPLLGRGSDDFAAADAMMPIAAKVWPESRRQVFRAFYTAITADSVGDAGRDVDVATAGSNDVAHGTGGLLEALHAGAAKATTARSRLAFDYALIAARAFAGDASVLSLLMMNPVALDEGESVFIPAGTPHAYLHGTAAEIMTNSDNVLRAGMTVKHKDIPNLLHTLDCHSAAPIDPAATNLVTLMMRDVVVYKPELEEFMLSYGHVDASHQQWPMADRLVRRYSRLAEQIGSGPLIPGDHGPRVLLCTQGAIHCISAEDECVLTCGQSVFIPAREGRLTVDAAADARIAEYADNGTMGTAGAGAVTDAYMDVDADRRAADMDAWMAAGMTGMRNARGRRPVASGSFIMASTQL